MRRLTGLGLVGVALSLLVVQPAWGDVIRSKRKAPAPDTRAVQEGLARVGVRPAEAADQSRDLMTADAAYFAERGDRVQLVGGLAFEEIVGGAVVFVALLGVYVFIQGDIDDKNN
jgi:hypothetical protein